MDYIKLLIFECVHIQYLGTLMDEIEKQEETTNEKIIVYTDALGGSGAHRLRLHRAIGR